MGVTHRSVLPVVAVLLLLAACRGETTPDVRADVEPRRSPLATATSPGDGQEVLGRGTVTDVGDGPVLCVGPVAESAPPQCGGVPVVGLDVTSPSVASVWNGEPGSGWTDELVLVGTYDGATFTVTEDPTYLGLFDPIIPLIPRDPATLAPVGLDEAELTALAREVQQRLRPPATANVADGHVLVEVAYDDGTLQDVLDREHGRDVVVVRPVLMPLPGG